MWAVTIKRQNPDDKLQRWHLEANYQSDVPAEVVKWMRTQAERIRKEPYMAPRTDDEEPLPGLGN